MPRDEREIARAPDGRRPPCPYGRRRTRRLTDSGSIRRCILAVPALALVAAAAAGCTIESGPTAGKISTTASSYLRALARGDTAGACAQLTRRAQGRRYEAAMKERRLRLEPDTLTKAADGSLHIDVHGNTATARLPAPAGARFALAKVGARWRIDSGYTLASAAAPRTHHTIGPGYEDTRDVFMELLATTAAMANWSSQDMDAWAQRYRKARMVEQAGILDRAAILTSNGG